MAKRMDALAEAREKGARRKTRSSPPTAGMGDGMKANMEARKHIAAKQKSDVE